MNDRKKELRIVLAASGTGGHLLPARYIADAIKQKCVARGVTCLITFIGSGRPLEQSLIAEHGYPLVTIPLHGIASRGVKGIFQAVIEYPGAAWKIYSTLRAIRPDYIIGVGGYVSVLPVLIGSLCQIPTWIHEAELRPGMATKFLGYFARTISVAFAEARVRQKEKIVFTGHPLRADLKKVSRRFGERKHILVIGGSQGAKVLDTEVPHALAKTLVPNLLIRHQSRRENVSTVLAEYQAQGVMAEVSSFIEDMVEAYSWADLVVSRAGAGSVKELEFLRMPALLVPLQSVNGHQVDNAKTLVGINGTAIVEEGQDFSINLQETLATLLKAETLPRDTVSSPDIPLAQELIADRILKSLL